MKKIFTTFIMMLCAACVASAANYLTFTAEEDSSSFGIVNAGNNPDVQYSLDDGETWIALAEGDTVVLVHKGDKALLKGVNPEGVSRDGQRSTFKMTGKVAASGSLMSLIDGTGLATEIPGYACFDQLFIGCTSLTKAPELSATTLAGGCYSYMFYGCTNLSEIRASFDEWERGSTSWWVKDVAPTGTFICPKALALEYGEDRIPEGWTVKFIDDTVAAETNYLTFTAEEDGSTFGIVHTGENNPDVQYSLDGGETWTALAAGDTITLAHKGDKALLKGNNPQGFSFSRWNKYSSFTMTGKVAASGSVMSLIDGIGKTLVVPADYCFYALFKGCTSLTQAPELPATTLAEGCYQSMFSGCTSLTQAPELPATSLSNYCYLDMFSGCTSLTEAPELPATTLAGGCYYYMFEGCTSLTQAPELPATTLAEGCYQSMFSGCTSLTQAPELPATTLPTTSNVENGCYSFMFEFCTSLTQAPELPATTLAEGCYTGMFYACTSLTQAPKLPATTLADLCYFEMFSGCTSLSQAPELPATTLAEGCYYEMFSGCTSLSEIKVPFDDWNHGDYTAEWVIDVAPTGTFICPKDLPLEYGDSRIPEGWTVKYIDDTVAVETNYLTFTAEEDGSTFGIAYNYLTPDVQYSLNGGETWTELAVGDTILLAKKGDKAHIRGYNEGGLGSNGKDNVHFIMTGAIAASGSVMSLIDGIGLSLKIPKESCFWYLFENCTSLTQAPEVPATTLAEWCYYGMFSGCTSLTQAPELPATTLADWCYRAMFEGCTGLIQVPELPATTLARSCYEGMFSGCTSLAQAPALPATTLVSSCYEGMFSGCTSLAQASALPATNLAPSCYCEMFSGCTSLTQAPALSAMKLVFECYSSMFSGCTSLTQAPELPATTLADDCYSRMFWGCTSLAQAPELPATTMAIHCYEYMFYGCTSLTKAPELPATELPDSLFMRRGCCESMFSGCTNLSEISIAFDKWNDNTFEWVKDVAPTGTFYCPKALPLEYGVDRIPEGWTVEYIEGEGSGVNTTLANNITIWTDGLTIYIRGAERVVSLYDVSGKRVAVSNSADEERALNVPARGVYVVRTSGGERSVLVR
ncbi:MAG: leucine-rich repeat protein [Bacteroidales bacterium]|nr:leucine-rich repeat protein [Bacteroidales bacterium]